MGVGTRACRRPFGERFDRVDNVLHCVGVGAVEDAGFAKRPQRFGGELVGRTLRRVRSAESESSATVSAGPADGAVPVLAVDGVAQLAGIADAFANEPFLVDAREWVWVERRGTVSDGHELVALRAARKLPEAVVEHLADELSGVVLGGSDGPFLLLLGGELAVVKRPRFSAGPMRVAALG